MISLFTKIALMFTILLLVSCHTEPSLQRYFVDSSENKVFQNISLSPQSFIKNAESLSEENRAQLENITKLNVLMLKNDSKNDVYETELNKLNKILKQEQYKPLLNAGEPSKSMEVLYVGEGKQIKEIIFFGNDKSTGFVVARVLGNDLSPENIYKIMLLGNQLDMSELSKIIGDFTQG